LTASFSSTRWAYWSNYETPALLLRVDSLEIDQSPARRWPSWGKVAARKLAQACSKPPPDVCPAMWIEHARKVTERNTGTRKTTRAGATAERERSSAIREWSQQNGYTVSELGRISVKVLQVYEAQV